MANQWYYTKDEERQGPVSTEELKKLAADGELLPEDLIWKDGMEDWRPASQLKGLFAGGDSGGSGGDDADADDAGGGEPTKPAATPAPSSQPAGGDRSAVWQIPQMIAATLFIVSMFLPWWSAKLSGKPGEIFEAFSKEEDMGRGRVRRRMDQNKVKNIYANIGWYARHMESSSINLKDFPFDGPGRDEEIDVRAKVWGFHFGLGTASGFFGFALIPLSIVMMGSRDARRFSWVTSFLAAYLSFLLAVMTVLWYLQTPGYDVKPVFYQGAHFGPYLVMGGTALMLAFGIIDGFAGLKAFRRGK